MTHKKWSAKERVDIMSEFLPASMGVAGVRRRYGIPSAASGSRRRRFVGAGKREPAGIGGNGRGDLANALAGENEPPGIVAAELTPARSAPRKSLDAGRG